MRFFNPTLLLGAMVAAAPMALAQNYVAAPASGNPGQLQQLPPLEQLLAPIALYPDPLIALILPASAFPNQIQAVAANLNGADDPSFDPSIQGLAHYPDIINWLNANLAWTQQLGGAFASSQADVMNAIQSLRQRARAAGTLVPSNNEQVLVDADNQIEILPVQAEAVSIPTYDPSIVYWAPPPGYDGSYFSWSEPYPIGAWMSYDFDWHRRALWYGDWYTYRRAHGGWNHPIDGARVNFSVAIGHGRPYRAPAHAPGSPVGHGFFGHNDHIVQPRAEVRGGQRGPAAEVRRGEPARDHPAPQARPVLPRPEERPGAHNENPNREQPHREVRSVPHSPAPAHPVPVRPEGPHQVPVHNAPPHPVQGAHPPVHPAAPHPEAPHPQAAPQEHHDAAPEEHHDH